MATELRTRRKRSPKPAGGAPEPPAPAPDPVPGPTPLPPDRIAVRMYRDILGDCFLLRIPADGQPTHVLIDCGILQGMPEAEARARRIMADIARETNHLDVLIVTHEHWDHLSGFRQASDIFDRLTVGELWLAWTEDDRDELARRLRAGRERALKVIERSFSAIAKTSALAAGAEEDDEEDEMTPSSFGRMDGVAGLMAFAGRAPGLAATGGTGTILDMLRAKAASVRFLKPGQSPLRLPGAIEFRAHILGPPRDEARLKRSNPSKTRPEVFHLADDTVGDDIFFLAALPMEDTDPVALDLSRPFARKYLLNAADPRTAVADTEEREALEIFVARYEHTAEAWRRIDDDWLGAGEQLALKLDSDTNNTSLAIAFEIGRGPTSRVLLFPGDAQVGNWLSWGDYRWQDDVQIPGSALGIEDLLSKTVLYKVGHHGSHNATLRERGLELMTNENLVAMIPVDEDFAQNSKHWNMPFPSLLERLETKTGGRILRADRRRADLEATAAARAGKTGELSRAAWEAFLDLVADVPGDADPVAIEYAIRL